MKIKQIKKLKKRTKKQMKKVRKLHNINCDTLLPSCESKRCLSYRQMYYSLSAIKNVAREIMLQHQAKSGIGDLDVRLWANLGNLVPKKEWATILPALSTNTAEIVSQKLRSKEDV